jgi:outer membrane protein
VFPKLLTGSLIAALMASTAIADTLRDALVSAYQANPTLTGQREALRATDATVAIARSAGRPQVSGTVGLNRDLSRSGILDTGGKGPTLSAGVDLSYPLFNGGRIRNSIRAADERVLAGRADLRATEGDVFTEAVAAYMDVIRDRSIVTLNRNQVRVLETNLQASRDRFEVGDLTRTDVAQSEARLSIARSTLATAQGRLTMMLLMGLPPGLVILLLFVNRGFISVLFTDPIGHILIAIGLTLQVVGFFMIRRIIHIQV